MFRYSRLLILAICFALSYVFAITWVVVMTYTLPSSDGAYGQTPFEDPLVLPVMSLFAAIAAIAVFPFTYVAFRDCSLPIGLAVLTAVVLIEILLITPISSFLGLVGSFVAYAVGLMIARRTSITGGSHIRPFRFSLRSLLVGVSVFAVFLSFLLFLKSYQDPHKLIDAANRGDLAAVEDLLSRSADVHARDGWSSTALMYAASKGHFEIVKRLLAAGAPLNERSRMDRTPLMWAARRGQLQIVDYLLKNGADIDAVDIDGRTALDLATDRHQTKMIERLNEFRLNQEQEKEESIE